jgi:hypothetical protein
MSAQPLDRADGRVAYRTATATTDDHTATCPACAAGVCGRADALMTDEYRTFERWSDTDPAGARNYDRATWPTEG